MNSSDPKAAAERLRRWQLDQFSCNMQQVADDRKTLAEAWMEEHAADDDEPIDEHFILLLGFTKPTRLLTTYEKTIDDYDGCCGEARTVLRLIDCHDEIGAIVVSIDEAGNEEGGVGLTKVKLTTRGQLRRLIEVLG